MLYFNWGWQGSCDGYYLSNCYFNTNKGPDYWKGLSKSAVRTGTRYEYRYRFNMVKGTRR